jgi:hypothetical protein
MVRDDDTDASAALIRRISNDDTQKRREFTYFTE